MQWVLGHQEIFVKGKHRSVSIILFVMRPHGENGLSSSFSRDRGHFQLFLVILLQGQICGKIGAYDIGLDLNPNSVLTS